MPPKKLALLAVIDALLILIAGYADAHPLAACPALAPPIQGERLTLDTGESLQVLIVPEIDALCLHFEDWALMETEVTLAPQQERQRAYEAQELCLSQIDVFSKTLAEAYSAPYESWDANLKALEEAQARQQQLDSQVRVWRSVAVGAGVASLILGGVLYLSLI